MNIAISDIYGKLYKQDRLFDLNACSIGQNLLMPGIELQKSLKKKGHEYHTVDMFSVKDIDMILFQEIPYSWYTLSSLQDKCKYILKLSMCTDRLLYAVKKIPKKNRCLLIMEPPIVAASSYNMEFHNYFGKILTWDDKLIDNKKYFKFFYPQPVPQKEYHTPYLEKKNFTMICGNKKSLYPNELYSARRRVIDFFETNEYEFDLYGFGWEAEGIKNYRGKIKNKLDVLSNYKYAFCYENQCNVYGYITEKIFDCFFAGCIPIYLGAENIVQYIPDNTFIARDKFTTIEELIHFTESIDENQYETYLRNIKNFLQSEQFSVNFSVQAYVKNMEKFLLG